MARSSRSRTRLAIVTGACALSAALLPLLEAPASAAPPAAGTAVAQQGAAYLTTLINSSGFVPDAGGAADLGSTVQAILALHAAGTGKSAAQAAEAYVDAHADAYLGTAGPTTDDPGRLARLILVAVATGEDPAAYGATSIDLVARLVATQRTTGTDAGLFGAGDPTFDGAFRQGLALAALGAAGVTNTAGTGWLVGQQCPDGGWEAYRSDTSVACTPPDPVNFVGEDTNSTALAAEGLVAQGVTVPTSPVAFLQGLQATDGGFGFVGGASDPDSTAVVIQALIALGQDPASPTWTKGSATPFTALASFQLGCSTSTPGAFYATFNPGVANLVATLDAVPAAAGEPFPLEASTLTTEAANSCAVAPPTATPTPTASPTASVAPTTASAAPTASVQGDSATLPATGGSDTALLLAFAGLCLVSGATAVGFARRRHGAHQR